jgi:hypothetical protein
MRCVNRRDGPTAAKSASQVIRLGSLDLRVFVYLEFSEPARSSLESKN